MKTYRRVLTIAGSDSGGGAGIQADMKTISACGCYAATAITAITAQNTQGVTAIETLPAEIVARQIEAVITDIGVDAVKIGMLPSRHIIEAVTRLITRYDLSNVVLDPVMVATSGDRLIPADAATALVTELMPHCTVITPNIPEAEHITGLSIRTKREIDAAATSLRDLGAPNILIKTGHLDAQRLTDYLFADQTYRYTFDRLSTPNTHGTGCTLSSAIASFLALGHPLPEAVSKAEEYLHKAIRAGAEYTIGNGHGPVHHFYRYWD